MKKSYLLAISIFLVTSIISTATVAAQEDCSVFIPSIPAIEACAERNRTSDTPQQEDCSKYTPSIPAIEACAERNRLISGGSSGSLTNPSTIPDSGPINTDCDPEDQASGADTQLDSTNCGIVDLLVKGINFLSALAGMAIIASIMIAGYQYMTAQDNSGQIQAARTRIIWAIVALLIFIFMYAFLNWVVPGGVI